MEISKEIFREYDIRGTVDKNISEEFAYLLGRAYAQLALRNSKDKIGIGYDCRHSSKPYATALAKGMSDEGISSVITGMGPTPQLYYSIFAEDLGGGIQVTGSHNPPEMNGFKLCLGTETLAGEDIQEIYQDVLKLQNKSASAKNKGNISEINIRPKYINELIENSRSHMGKRKIKVVVDAGNGVGGMVGPDVLRGLGAEVIELYCDPDGNFPNHHPDPTVMENIEELIHKVKETKADFGIGWDGDADRIGVVDENGKVIFGDMLVLIFGREILKSVPGAIVIGDVKCSSRLFEIIDAAGGKSVMWKTGHSLIKKKLKEINGHLAGEMSGHIAFKHRYYGFDDALYSSSRFLEIVSKLNGPVSSLLADVPKMVSTPEIRVDCPEEIKFKIPKLAKKVFSKYKLETLDGVRITFDNGWGLVRASNTQPVLVMRFEANDQATLDKYQKLVVDGIEQIKRDLNG